MNCMDYLDHQNYMRSQDHVELLDEPWLVADIVINRPLYWCGYSQYIDLLMTWDEFKGEVDGAQSGFWLALAVSRHKYASLEIR